MYFTGDANKSLKSSQKATQCSQETIHRGKTSIYIFGGEEVQQECAEDISSKFSAQRGDEANEDNEFFEHEKCSNNVKRSASAEDETIVVVKKKGNKVFIEI